MAKDKIAYVCDNCGQESSKWIGKCPSCGQWNTFKEIRVSNDTGSQAAKSAAMSVRSAMDAQKKNRPLFLHEISAKDEPRMDMHDAELNRVLGGGLVPGSIVLLGGEPGIGKSTLTLQTILRIPERRASRPGQGYLSTPSGYREGPPRRPRDEDRLPRCRRRAERGPWARYRRRR